LPRRHSRLIGCKSHMEAEDEPPKGPIFENCQSCRVKYGRKLTENQHLTFTSYSSEQLQCYKMLYTCEKCHELLEMLELEV
jgi:hypothetical protein